MDKKVDLFGSEIKMLPKEERWNAVMVALEGFYNYYYFNGMTSEEGILSTAGERVLDNLANAYDVWLN